MGAALHLAHAQEIPPQKRRRKRGGSGGGGSGGGGPAERFSSYAKRIYADERASAEVRSLLVAVAHAVSFGPPGEEWKAWERASRALGHPEDRGSRRALRDLIQLDVPRYAPPGHWEKQYCVGLRLRPHPGGPEDFRNVEKVCGAPGKERAVERLPGTGWHRYHWYCDRHRWQLHEVRRRLEEQNSVMAAKQPMPNRGGLLPVYFHCDWVAIYRWALEDNSWKPPVHGICADDWNTPPPRGDVEPEDEKVKGRLRLIVCDYEDDVTP